MMDSQTPMSDMQTQGRQQSTRRRLFTIFGIVLASVNAIVQLAFIRHFPAWSIIIMALDVIVIYALTVHDSEFA